MRLLKETLFLLGDKRRKLPWLISLFLFASLLDLVGLGLIVPYMLLIINPDSLSNGYLGELLEQFFPSLATEQLIVIMSVILVSIFILKAFSAIIVNRIIIVFSLDIQNRLKYLLMESYQNLNYTEYLHRNSSEYIVAINKYTSDFATGVLSNFLRLISEGISLIVILMLLAFSNGFALLLLIILLGSLSFGFDRFFRSRLAEFGHMSNSSSIRMIQGINEGIEGLKEIRILGKESFFRDVVKTNSEILAKYSSKSQVIVLAPRYLLEMALVSFIVVLVLSALWMNIEMKTLVPTLSLFGFAAMRLIPSTNVIISGLSQLRLCRNSTSKLYKDLSDEKSNPMRVQEVKKENTFHSLVFNQVSFHYPNASQNALNNLNLSLNEGESIGFIGTSGAGKTTLIDVMLGLLEPQHGVIKFNGQLLKQCTNEWRANVAYLPQEVFLIDNTLRCNVALGVEEEDIDEEQLNKSLSRSRLTELVSQLPDGVNTILGERGVRLSGGQRQRIALARAFYHSRNVLVMDEATSALDNQTEQEIVEEIKQLKGKVTLIVIAHRHTTVQHCDRIYRLEKGTIVEQGSYESMVEKK